MMGSKERHFAPLMHVSLEELVPQDHFYRNKPGIFMLHTSGKGGAFGSLILNDGL
jgi:hypothetical protein